MVAAAVEGGPGRRVGDEGAAAGEGGGAAYVEGAGERDARAGSAGRGPSWRSGGRGRRGGLALGRRD